MTYRSQEERGRSAAHPQPVPTEPCRGPDKNISVLFEWLGSCWGSAGACRCLGGSASWLRVLKTAQVSALSGFSAGKQQVFLAPCLSKSVRKLCKQECCSGLPFPFLMHPPSPEIEPASLALAGGFSTTEPTSS